MESIGTSLPAAWLSRRQAARMPPATHVIAGSLPESLLSSRARGWDGLVVELYSFSDLDVVVQAPDHVIAVHLAGTVTLRRTLAGRTRTRKMTSGDITITPVGPRVRWQQTSPSLVILLRLAPEYVRHMAGDECAMDPDRFEIQDVFATRDAIIENLGRRLLAGLELEGVDSHLYVDTLTCELALHLLTPLHDHARQRLAADPPVTAQAAVRHRLHRREPWQPADPFRHRGRRRAESRSFRPRVPRGDRRRAAPLRASSAASSAQRTCCGNRLCR